MIWDLLKQMINGIKTIIENVDFSHDFENEIMTFIKDNVKEYKQIDKDCISLDVKEITNLLKDLSSGKVEYPKELSSNKDKVLVFNFLLSLSTSDEDVEVRLN